MNFLILTDAHLVYDQIHHMDDIISYVFKNRIYNFLCI